MTATTRAVAASRPRLAGLAFEGLAGGYGSTEVVHGLGGAVAPGEVLAVVGRNGVGKTSLLKLLTGQLAAWRGSVQLGGQPLAGLAPPQRHALGLGYCPQERPVFDTLSVRDNLVLGPKAPPWDRYAPYLERFAVLGRRLSQHAGTLSGGERKLLAFTRCLAENQPVLLLDEPSEGVQWENILHMAELIAQQRASGAALVVVEQNLEFATRIADRYLVLDQGRLVLEGRRDTLTREQLLAHLHI